ncbi:hypothetical protein [Cupriavidus sp. D384]|uniref:hypothetical protein n=1 Tax=Cupriavidus sp. D384 TaxID=1538095 RepID=UPI000829E5EF|nr:hypothetical protein [Cupriavidus sp. D384]
MAEKLDLDALERNLRRGIVRIDPEVQLAMIARIRELEARVELGSNLLREQTDKTCAANLRVIELESASQPGGGEAAKVEAVRANFTPFFIMSNVRRIVPAYYNKQRANWVLAMDVFAVGSRSAQRICEEAGIDPDGFTVERAAPSAGNGGAEER